MIQLQTNTFYYGEFMEQTLVQTQVIANGQQQLPTFVSNLCNLSLDNSAMSFSHLEFISSTQLMTSCTLSLLGKRWLLDRTQQGKTK